ncbi:MAG TPA: type I DNA topoisomerase [Clostridiales bacterium]|nr:type I DNA topoisomerase [Clostridiales bacterium]
MPRYLVIVESPAKAKTIKKFLGKNYEVLASNGHVRDLPKSRLGIDTENDYEPRYITIRGKGEILAKLRKEVKKSDKVFLATDPDREGEAISWHLSKALKLDEDNIMRITFNEITKSAIKDSIKKPRNIDMDLVDAQQARRILDRMVGYKISPVLWVKIKRGLSAGRVQSVALRLICDREEEVNAFVPEEYWNLEASFDIKGKSKLLIAKYLKNASQKTIKSRQEMDELLDLLSKSDFVVESIKKNERTKKSPMPFITSTLQQEAAKTLNYSTQKTMRLAQQLYEGIDIKGHGTVGLITYLRTDSIRISDEAKLEANKYIEENYGAEYIIEDKKEEKVNKKIQDAHEAIRPTNIEFSPDMVKASLTRDLFRLYQLIWKRFTASCMKAAIYETTSMRINNSNIIFSASGSEIIFDGFMKVYVSDKDEIKDKIDFGKLKAGDKLSLIELTDSQHFTQPPAYYNEASLVKTLEELGIGRPSTYAPTITTILARRYIVKEEKNLYVTELGEAVNNIMVAAFPSVINANFTASLEALLDSVEDGTIHWKTVIRNFYPDLDEAVQKAEADLEKIVIEDEVTEEICEQCGKNMVIKYGPYGKFLACPGFPECRNAKPHFEKIGVECPLCGEDIVLRKSKKGRKFYACIKSPDCEYMSWPRPSKIKCEKCNGLMLEKGKKLMCASVECGYVTEIETND